METVRAYQKLLVKQGYASREVRLLFIDRAGVKAVMYMF